MTSAEAFAALPGAQVLHLHHNKHELTFMLSSEAGETEGDGNAEIRFALPRRSCCWPDLYLRSPS